MSRRVFDESFRKMAIDLSNTRGSVKEIADELGISHNLLSKWKQRETESKDVSAVLTEEQKLIKKLQKELKDSQMERDILKKAVGIFSKGDGRYSDL